MSRRVGDLPSEQHMRLSPENARRLTQLVWRERARRWVPVILVAITGLAALAYMTELQIGRVDRTVDVVTHDATVLEVKNPGARGAAVFRVHLDDGRDVDAVSTMRLTPAQGAHTVVTEAKHASGRLTFDVVRLAE
jgi:hypothetical protein